MDNNVSVAATNFHAVIAAWPLKRTWQEDVLEKFPEPRDHLSETDNLRFSRKRVFEDKAFNPLRGKVLAGASPAQRLRCSTSCSSLKIGVQHADQRRRLYA